MPSDVTYTISHFCEAEHISRAMPYKLWAQGKGPRYYLIGARRRIPHQARVEWQQAREAETRGAADVR
jgi:hypothetical protein